jgi:hypothetical protein
MKLFKKREKKLPVLVIKMRKIYDTKYGHIAEFDLIAQTDDSWAFLPTISMGEKDTLSIRDDAPSRDVTNFLYLDRDKNIDKYFGEKY